MRLFFVFLSLLIISTPTAFAETITLKCDYNYTKYSKHFYAISEPIEETIYLTINLDAKTVSYIDGTPSFMYNSVSANESLIILEGKNKIYKPYTTINRYTGAYYSRTSRWDIEKNVFLGYGEAKGSCQPYTRKQLF